MGICLKCNNSTCDLLCTKHPMIKTTHPISGETYYVSDEEDISTGPKSRHKYESCVSYNQRGQCTDFEPESMWHNLKMTVRWIPNSL